MVYERIVRLLAAQLELDERMISESSDIFKDLGADSLDVVELFMTAEEEFGILLSDGLATDLRTVREIADYFEALV